jgi:hypothetical protein
MLLLKLSRVIVFSLAIGFFSVTGYADSGGGKGHGKGHSKIHSQNHGKGHGKSTHIKSAKTFGNTSSKALTKFSKTDKAAITNYFNKNPLSASALPPGIAMNLARGKPLPPGIAKRYLPSDLVAVLPPRPGYEYLVVGDDVVLVNTTTEIVTDILSNLLH